MVAGLVIFLAAGCTDLVKVPANNLEQLIPDIIASLTFEVISTCIGSFQLFSQDIFGQPIISSLQVLIGGAPLGVSYLFLDKDVTFPPELQQSIPFLFTDCRVRMVLCGPPGDFFCTVILPVISITNKPWCAWELLHAIHWW